MTAIFYDTHAHLDFPDFAADLPEVVARAQAAGITKIISIGTDLESSRRAVAIAERFPAVFAAVGWHPAHVSSAPPDIRPALRQLAVHPSGGPSESTNVYLLRREDAQVVEVDLQIHRLRRRGRECLLLRKTHERSLEVQRD